MQQRTSTIKLSCLSRWVRNLLEWVKCGAMSKKFVGGVYRSRSFTDNSFLFRAASRVVDLTYVVHLIKHRHILFFEQDLLTTLRAGSRKCFLNFVICNSGQKPQNWAMCTLIWLWNLTSRMGAHKTSNLVVAGLSPVSTALFFISSDSFLTSWDRAHPPEAFVVIFRPLALWAALYRLFVFFQKWSSSLPFNLLHLCLLSVALSPSLHPLSLSLSLSHTHTCPLIPSPSHTHTLSLPSLSLSLSLSLARALSQLSPSLMYTSRINKMSTMNKIIPMSSRWGRERERWEVCERDRCYVGGDSARETKSSEKRQEVLLTCARSHDIKKESLEVKKKLLEAGLKPATTTLEVLYAFIRLLGRW